MTIRLNRALSTESFVKEIESLVVEHGMNWIDAVVEYCDKRNIEVETAASIIRSNPKIKSKIQFDAETLNYLPKESRLPIDTV